MNKEARTRAASALVVAPSVCNSQAGSIPQPLSQPLPPDASMESSQPSEGSVAVSTRVDEVQSHAEIDMEAIG